ncbi:MAG: glycosyltransferase [Oscillospiraceae bacterium]|nr:glycosyltransferase [Oscillospiraceae bacterium]
MPKVSVILPAYNAEKYIKEAMDSILSQTFADFELIVLNDCSQDSTEELILSYEDPRVVYVKNEENLGVARTLNRGLALAKGEYIARMDADDISLRSRFEKQAAYLDTHSNVAVLGSNVELFDENGTIQTGWSSTDPRQLKLDLFFACPFAHPGVMMRTAVIRELGGYDPEYEGLEDYELWYRVSRKANISTLADVLLRYRLHGGQVTQNPSERYRQRLLALKRRQLGTLGMEDNDAYFDYCLGKKPQTAEQVLAWCRFLETALEANQTAGVYDPVLMERYFCTVALSAVASLGRKDALTVCRETKLVSFGALVARKAKALLRRIGK